MYSFFSLIHYFFKHCNFRLDNVLKWDFFGDFQTLWTLASSLKGHFSRGPASPCDLQNNEFPFSQNSRQHLWESIMYRVILRRFEFCHKNRIRGAKTLVYYYLEKLFFTDFLTHTDS